MGQSAPGMTIGVEEEFQVVDPTSRQLRQRGARIVARARGIVGDDVTQELYLSQVEVGTPICNTLADVRAELIRLRRAVIDSARLDGCRIAATGTHPFSDWRDQELTPKLRYEGLLEEFQQLTREQIICGCHVHVGIDDREEAIRVMNRARPWLPPILALSANSPYWQGVDTGYASYRTELFGRYPMSGVPIDMASRAEFDGLIADLVRVGSIDDASKIYWDIRPSMHFETLEFRIADICQSIDEAVMVAGLCRGLALACVDRPDLDAPEHRVRPELLRAAKWRAARFGLEGDLIDLPARKSVPAAGLVASFLDFLRPTLESLGEWDELSTLVHRTLERGNGATRQRRAFQESGGFEGVVDAILQETTSGLA